MKSGTWLFCFCVLNVHRAITVRIFDNILPMTMSAMNVQFEAEVISKTCLLKPQRGPCRANITMHYYNAQSASCAATFKWGGCQGNGNRFDTEEECKEKCLSKRGDPRRRPKWCALTFDYGFCFGAIERYYFDNLWRMCKKTIYSGCGGNRNNFLSREQCESVCLFRKGPIESVKTTTTSRKKVLIVNPRATLERPLSTQNSTGADGNGTTSSCYTTTEKSRNRIYV